MTTAEIIIDLFYGFGVTLGIFALTLAISLPLGLLIAFGLLTKFKPVRITLDVIVWIVRGTPLMLQVIFVYYGPGLIMSATGWDMGIFSKLDELTAVAIAFSLNYACYFAVIFKGGISSVPTGQWEACFSLGMTRALAFKNVIFPQVYKNILHPMSNETITLIKDTSIARIIGTTELIFVGEKMLTKGMIAPFFSTALFYLAVIGLLTILFAKLEKRENRYC